MKIARPKIKYLIATLFAALVLSLCVFPACGTDGVKFEIGYKSRVSAVYLDGESIKCSEKPVEGADSLSTALAPLYAYSSNYGICSEIRGKYKSDYFEDNCLVLIFIIAPNVIYFDRYTFELSIDSDILNVKIIDSCQGGGDLITSAIIILELEKDQLEGVKKVVYKFEEV